MDFTDILMWVKNISLVVLAFASIVFFHELGHLITGRLAGIGVEVFSINMGRPIFKFTWRGVKYQIGWIPLGGYCKFKGQSDFGAQETTSDPDDFYKRPPWARTIAAFGGPFFSYLWGLAIFSAFFFFQGETISLNRQVSVPLENQAYTELRNGDIILSIEGNEIFNWNAIDKEIRENLNKNKIKIN